jgi:hypothetical protein
MLILEVIIYGLIGWVLIGLVFSRNIKITLDKSIKMWYKESIN